MFKFKLMTSFILAALVIVAQFGAAYADDSTPTPPVQTATPATPITGTVQSTTLQTDSTGQIIVVVTVLDSTGATQTVDLSVNTAVSLGLVTLDSSGQPVVNQTQIGQSITIDPSQIIPTTTPTPTAEPQNPVAAALAMFFGVDNATINGYHTDGYGYGVIAQALWMSKILNGDATLAGQILAAKTSGDYSAFTFADGTTIPTNWGQFRKDVLMGQARDNLGTVMSGNSGGMSTPGANGHGNSNGQHGNGGGNGNGHGHGNGKP